MLIQQQIRECSRLGSSTKQLSTLAHLMSQDSKARLLGGEMLQRGAQHIKQRFCLYLKWRPVLEAQVCLSHDGSGSA